MRRSAFGQGFGVHKRKSKRDNNDSGKLKAMDIKEQKKEFCEELGISESRGDELVKLVHDIYFGKQDSIVSVMFRCREYAATAKEDMFVCYLVGFVHAMELKQTEITVIDLRK